jgi:hypothetical protein
MRNPLFQSQGRSIDIVRSSSDQLSRASTRKVTSMPSNWM